MTALGGVIKLDVCPIMPFGRQGYVCNEKGHVTRGSKLSARNLNL
jgi:hypothetical protein